MTQPSRRALLAVAAGAVLAPAAARADEKKKDEVPPIEDLMREHGVIRRDLLVYDELARRIESGGEPPQASIVARAAQLMRRFAEGYHEQLEETLLFPKLQRDAKLKPLVEVLVEQHAAGRKVTDELLASAKRWSDGQVRSASARKLRGFIHMYQAHAAREDTVAFVAARKLMTAQELDALGDQFEDGEHRLLGPNGFEDALAEVAQLEKALGIDDLARFTVR